MKNLLRFFLMLISFALFSCDKEDDLSITDDVYTPPVIAIKGSIAGLVINEAGDPIVGAIVRVGSEQKETGPGGYFIFTNITLNANGTFIKVDQSGYFHASRRFYPKVNAMNYTKLTLMAKNNAGQVSATTGGTVNVTGGATVKLPANGMAKTDGTLYTGQVRVAARWLNPTAGNLTDIMPGNLQAINDQREEVALATYGMVAVELTGTDGSPLNLASGSKAELSFPIPSQLQSSAPSEIPLWHFDETTGLWREEGFAVRQGNVYVGEVSHFSFWNCDAPFPVIHIEGRLLAPNGNPLVDVGVQITIAGTAITGYGHTNAEGVFSGKVPSDQPLVLTVVDYFCTTNLLEINVGSFNSDSNLGDINVAGSSNDNFITVSGSVLNCENTPVTEGMVQICRSDYCNFVAINTDGSFESTFRYCNMDEIEVAAFDLETGFASIPQVSAILQELIDFGNISVCGSQIPEYLRINVNNMERTYFFPYYFRGEYPIGQQPGVFMAVGSWGPMGGPDSSYAVRIYFPETGVGTYSGAGVRFDGYDTTPSYMVAECAFPCDAFTVTVTEFSSTLGGYIRGTFGGTMDYYDENQQLIGAFPVTGEFSFRR